MRSFQFEGETYTARMEPVSAVANSYAADRDDREIHPGAYCPRLVTISGPGFERRARFAVSQLLSMKLGNRLPSPAAMERFYLGEVDRFMRVPLAETKSHAGILGTPEDEWFHHVFADDETYDRLFALPKE